MRKLMERGRDPYQVLGVGTDASVADITRAFRRRALVEHPDRGGDPEAFRLLNEAREVLLDPVRRAAYDLSRVRPPADRWEAGFDPATHSSAAADQDKRESWAYTSGGRRMSYVYDPAAEARTVRPRAERFAWWKPARYAVPGQGRHRRADPVNRFSFLALLVALFVPLVGAVLAAGVLVQIRHTGARGAWAAWLAIGVSTAKLWGVSMFPAVF